MRGRCVASVYHGTLNNCMTVPARAMPTLAFHRFGAHLLVLLALMSIAPRGRRRRARRLPRRALEVPARSGQADDFRVRTNAALALGATDDDDAIAPLCGGLDDPSEVVRQAVAVALKRLARPSSRDCLQRRAAYRDERLGEGADPAGDRRPRRGERLLGRRQAAEAKPPPTPRTRSTTCPSRRSRTTPPGPRPTSAHRRAAPSPRSSRSSASTSWRPSGETQRRREGRSREAQAQGVLPRRQRRQARLLRREPARSRENRGILVPGEGPARRGARGRNASGGEPGRFERRRAADERRRRPSGRALRAKFQVNESHVSTKGKQR